MPQLMSVIKALDRLQDFAAVNAARSHRQQIEALLSLHESVGLDSETLRFIIGIVTETDLCDGVEPEVGFGLVIWGMSVALSAAQLEEDERVLDAIA